MAAFSYFTRSLYGFKTLAGDKFITHKRSTYDLAKLLSARTPMEIVGWYDLAQHWDGAYTSLSKTTKIVAVGLTSVFLTQGVSDALPRYGHLLFEDDRAYTQCMKCFGLITEVYYDPYSEFDEAYWPACELCVESVLYFVPPNKKKVPLYGV